MGLLESILAAVLVAVMSYVADRGIAFQICLYAAVASGGEFTAEQAYRKMENPFARPAKLLPIAGLIGLLHFLARGDGIRHGWEVALIFTGALLFVTISGTAALNAFRRTPFYSRR